MDRSAFHMCHELTRRDSRRLRIAVLLITVELGVSVAGAPVRFSSNDPLLAARDLRDASGVQAREISLLRDGWDGIRQIGDGTPRKALDVNSIDEVPDSSWFENRIATRPMSAAEIAAGPNSGGPAPGPWTVTSGKFQGVTPGLQMKDSAGQLYFVKFDPPAAPELASGSEIIATKLLYAAGYNVPENYIMAVN